MQIYLILRIIAFLAVGGMFFLLQANVWTAMMMLAIVHYFLAIPYSKTLIFDAVRRPLTGFYFLCLIAAAVAISFGQVEGLLYLAFGFHYAFSDVYLLHENVMPNMWNRTRPLRIASLFFNLSAYFAAVRLPVLTITQQQVEVASYLGCIVSLCTIAVLLLKLRHSLTKEQIILVCAFESLGVAFVLFGMMHPLPPSVFILYHVVFWLFYPTYKMAQYKQIMPLFKYLGANVISLLFLMMLMPFSPLPLKMSGDTFLSLFKVGSLFHIISTLGMTTAQPSFITRIFHPAFSRASNAEPTLVKAPGGQSLETVGARSI